MANPFEESSSSSSLNPFETTASTTSKNPFETEDTFSNNDVSRGEDVVIKEGLLCPFSECLQEFKTVAELHDHYNSVHVDDDKKNFSSQLKGFIGKASKMFKRDELERLQKPGYQASDPESYFYHSWRYGQQCGPTRSHFGDFSQIRDKRIDRYVRETNKLLITLDKLLRGAPTTLYLR